MEYAPDALLVLGLVSVAAGAFVMLGAGCGLVALGVALITIGVIYARSGV